MEEQQKLSDMINIETLQRLQDAFSGMAQMATVIIDAQGRFLTRCSKSSLFCDVLKGHSEDSLKQCSQCYKKAMLEAFEQGSMRYFKCHAGLTFHVAPIALEGKLVAAIVGGQILIWEPNEEKLRQLARETGISFHILWEAINKIPRRGLPEMERSADLLRTLASLMAELAYSRMATKELESAANMKSDFLANMSHEIRTPMNAVIGMAEMALREDLPPAAREYILQIKNSGRSLLNIINDILDFSKIESGKMDIITEEYEPLNLFNDVVNIISTRIRDKDVELLLHLNPDLPVRLWGDSQRIRQVLINLANNAVKFTHKGRVFIDIDFEWRDEENIDLKVSVQDTGIGIKKEDQKRLFQSFQQIDSKRNRSIEGTGLGLAISKRLVEHMGGQIGLESEYEKGSNFFFHVPQRIVDATPSLQVRDANRIFAVGYFSNKYIARQFYRDCKELSVPASALTDADLFESFLAWNEEIRRGKQTYLFVQEELFDENIQQILETHPNVNCVRLVQFDSTKKADRENLSILRKPYSTVALGRAFNNEEFNSHLYDGDNFEFDFVAPEAEVLIVDDNSINLTVAEGLLEPLKMKIFSAISGKLAIDQIGIRHFDLIFMDHMMPDLDGVETTRIIRRLHPDYSDVPIIALTANAMEGTKEMFLSEGMNDFVAKPIEVRTLVSKVKQWLPKEKILPLSEADIAALGQNAREEEEVLVIADLDTRTAIKLLGNRELFLKVLKDYYNSIESKYQRIKELEMAGDLPNYTIEVHALKSLSRQIGATELSHMAEELEKAGNAGNIALIHQKNGGMLRTYLGYREKLGYLFPEQENASAGEKPQLSADDLTVILDELGTACEDLDMDAMEECNEKLMSYAYPAEQTAVLEKLSEAVSNIDVDTVAELIIRWKSIL